MAHQRIAEIVSLLDRADRLLLLRRLSAGNVTCAQLSHETGWPRRAVARMLDELDACGVVTSRMVRNDVVYALASPQVAELVATLVELDRSTRVRRRHLRLVHSSDLAGAASPVPAAANASASRRRPALVVVTAAS